MWCDKVKNKINQEISFYSRIWNNKDVQKEEAGHDELEDTVIDSYNRMESRKFHRRD